MAKWIKENGNYRYLFVTILIGIIGWIVIQLYAMPDRYVRTERYTADRTRIETTLDGIQKDIKEILRMFK